MIFTVMRSGTYTYLDAEIAVADLATGEHRILTGGALARYSPTGHLLVVDIDGTLSALPFDADNMTAGDPVVLAGGVLIGSSGSFGSADLTLSEGGTLIFVEGELSGSSWRELVWVDRAGVPEPLDPDWGQAQFGTLALSPDGRRLAVDIGGEEARQIWVKELPDGPATRLTTDDGDSFWPAWSPDGETVIYGTDAAGTRHIRSIPSDGRSAGAYEVLLQGEYPMHAGSFTTDGMGLLYWSDSPSASRDLGYLDLTTGERNDAFLATEFSESAGVLSPDDRWLAYTSDATGRNEVFVRPFPEVDAYVRQVSRDGGTEPVWGREGGELFYRGGDGWMMVASYSAEPAFNVEDRTPLFDASGFRATLTGRDYDVSPSGDRFVMVRLLDPLGSDGSGAGEPRLVMIQNFFTELEERVGGGG
jgi:serine/threonine-protein kinase